MYLKDNVYFVEGKVNAAFYDLNTGDLYQVSEDAKTLINKNLNNSTDSFTKSERTFVNELIKMKLVTNDYVESHNIETLKEETNIEFAWIEITNICNLRCIHCYDEASCESGKVMTLDEFKHIIDELVLCRIKKMQIIGGEPFVLKEKLQD